ncbi:hypothetical protein A1O7_09550 [Cladophialophora yegresii CBS 114405]|uniref:Uncharacterized protein n=1 Tax=Cladophialophora yegresii CBS 114405 TaxID=1182544 RepID=W9VFF2_9EURO|nr:uncharacterized protein A1O7_09550 [Cladophialophora yegresii CBS 114405]EXJ54213.1 hypothetical protein A1O7_09550 [Cladophialophora yegresii CBS 114405]
MAVPTRASRALTFMRDCRSRTQRYASTEATPSPSPYAPSNFTRQTTPAAPSSAFDPVDDSSSLSASAASTTRPPYAHPISRPPPPSEIPGTRLTFTSWALSLVGIAPKPSATYTPAPFRVTNNPYRARKRWPPDFRTLDPKQQFHYEKTYRRRAALKWARPRWNKGVKLVQQTLITFTIIYFVFICEPGHGMGTPFDGFRVWFFDKLGRLGQLPESTREEAEKLSDEARQKMRRQANSAPQATNSPVAGS